MTYNPEEIATTLQQLKQEIRSQRLQDELAQSAAVAAALQDVQLHSWVNPHQPIAWPHWPKGLWPKIVAVVQKIIRRLLSWYITPIVEEQNQFNAAVVTFLNKLVQENTRLRAEVRMLAANQLDATDQQS